MRDKKKSESGKTSEQEELVQRVDSMMSTELPADVPPKPTVMTDEPDDKKPASSAPKNQKTAPELSKKLLKDKKAEETEVTKLETPDKPPIVISLADEDEDKASGEQPDESSEETPAKDPLEDKATDKAVDDIVAHEGDTVLAVNDALTARKQATAEPGQPSGPRSSHKLFWIIIYIILLGIAADAAIFLLRR